MNLRQVYRKVKGDLRDRILLHASYKRVFESPDGELVLKHIMKVAKVTRPTFVSGDPHQTSFNEGQRHLALSIMRFVRKNHDELIKQIERGIEDEDTI